MVFAPRGPMAGEDALLWTIDRDPVLRSTIVAVLVLDSAPAQQDVARLLQGLVELLPRLRWRGKRPPFGLGSPRWTVDDCFDLDQHLRRIAAPAPQTLDTVLRFAQVMAGTAFDPALPLWEAVVVEGLEHEQAALVLKFHHAVVDGVGGVAALVQAAGGRHPAPSVDGPGRAEPSARHGTHGVRQGALPSATRSHSAVSGWLHDLVTVGRLIAPAPSPRSPLARGRGVIRHFGVFDASLTELHRVADDLGVTVNDVFVAGVLGGLERYHELHGRPVDTLRGLIPVSIRDRGDALGTNRFVPMRFLLPAAVADPAERVRRVHEVLGTPVHDPALRMSDAIAAVMSRLPARLSTAAFGSMLKGNDFVATNVPGPRAEVRLAGARLRRIYAFSPPTGAGCNVSLVTVGRRACLGVNVDTAALPDDTMLLHCFEAAFAELVHLGRPVGARRRRSVP